MLASVSHVANVSGFAFGNTVSTDYPTVNGVGTTLAAAKTGTLTVRTDANTGTLTMTTGHGIPTGARIAIFWTDPTTLLKMCQHKVTVGTVATDSVPIDLGVGNDLPVAATAVTVQVTTDVDFLLESTVVDFLAASGSSYCHASFEAAAGTIIFATLVQSAALAYIWNSATGITAPITADVAKVWITNGDAAAANAIQIAAGSTL